MLLHIPTDATDQDIHDLIEAGFSAGTVKTLFESGSIRPRARDQIIPLKTLMQLREHGDQADASHGNRHARDHAGQHKNAAAWGFE